LDGNRSELCIHNRKFKSNSKSKLNRCAEAASIIPKLSYYTKILSYYTIFVLLLVWLNMCHCVILFAFKQITINNKNIVSRNKLIVFRRHRAFHLLVTLLIYNGYS